MKKILILLALMALIGSCSKNNNTIKVSSTNADNTISNNEKLYFTFNRNVVADSMINIPLERQPVEISPKIDGYCIWIEPNKLIFNPSADFNPSTKYTCKLSGITKHDPSLKFSGKSTFEFQTEKIEMTSFRAWWTVINSNQTIQCELTFNYQIAPASLNNDLDVYVNDTKKKYTFSQAETKTKNVQFSINDITPEDKDYIIKSILKEGYLPDGANLPTEKDFHQATTLVSPFILSIYDVTTEHDGISGIINVSASQAIEESEIRKHLIISPKVNYTVEANESYILIKSTEFDASQKYELTISNGLKGSLGGKLKFDHEEQLSFGQLQPKIKFLNSSEFYLSANGSRDIEVALVNVPEVKMNIYKVYQNNILAFYHQNNYYDYYDYDYGTNYNVGNFGDLIYSETIQTNKLERHRNHRLLKMNFEDKVPQINGIYVLELRSDEDYWVYDSKVLTISDIGMIAKAGDDNITVFVNSILTTEPLTGVEISVIGRNNQLLKSAQTDASGVATLNLEEFRFSGFHPALITAKSATDFNLLKLSNTRIETSRYDVGGKYENKVGLDAYIYGDRDLYRPGEKIHISGIVRNQNWQFEENLPVIVKFIAPNGKLMRELRKTLNKFGSFETSIQTESNTMTGNYTAQVFTTNDLLIGSSNIKVEEFMPDRIRVESELDKEFYKPGEKVNVSVYAENFFGPPASDRNCEIELSLARKYFSPKGLHDYNFSLENAENSFQNILRNIKTDDNGKVEQQFLINSTYKNSGMLEGSLYITVFDETGRPVNRIKKFPVATQDVFLGLKSEDYYVKTGTQVKMPVIAVDKDGNLLSGKKARVELIKHEYKTVLSKSGSYYRYRSEKIEKNMERKDITVNDKDVVYTFNPEQSGRYEVRLYLPGTHVYVNRFIYAYGWGSTSYGSYEVDKEGKIDIVLDKEKYQVGERAKVLFKAPFTGKLLVTVERDKVYEHHYIETDKRAAELEIDISEGFLPNVYISATLFKPHEKTDIPLTVAHGFAPLLVEKKSTKIDVSIEAPEKSRSSRKQTIKVKSRPNSAVTIAVVDEGILQVSGYPTPDPHGFFYQKRALDVSSYNIYPFLFPEPGFAKSHTGGGASMGKRVNPMPNNRVKLLAYWSGILETNAKGEAEAIVDIPSFSGEVRIMAVAYDGASFGMAQSQMKIADPVVLSAGIPRFLSPGDTSIIPLTMSNTTEEQANIKTTVTVTGPLLVFGEKSQNSTISAGKEAKVIYKIVADQNIGEGKITFEAKASGETFTYDVDIPVRPASPLQKYTESGSVEAGKTKQVSAVNEQFIPISVDQKLIVSKSPLVQFSKSLDYLLRYPYGCVEQTTSSAFPQIYYNDIAKLVLNDKRDNEATVNVQEAIRRLELMQLYNGALSYWPGSGNESWWGTAYAAHFLIEAQKAGFDVRKDMLDKMMDYLEFRLRKREFINYYYNSNQNRKIAPREVPYSLYVLALAGTPQVAVMNYYQNHPEFLSLDSKYMIAAAYALAGDKNNFRKMLPAEFSGERSEPMFGGSFSSALRDEALALNVLLEVDPENQQIGIMAKHVSEQLRSRQYLNTQERAFSFLAMGKIARKANKTDAKGIVKLNGKKEAEADNEDISIRITNSNAKIEIEATGTGALYYYYEAEGITKNNSFRNEDNYLAVRRNYYNRNGARITSNQFKQNDLILVQLEVKGLTNTSVQNVVVSDMLPAGFEIENPRLTELPPGMSWPTKRSTPDYMDIRDDRVNFFADIYSTNSYYFYYLVRAVSRGTFIQGPASADAMYNSEYHSYSGGGTIIVE